MIIAVNKLLNPFNVTPIQVVTNVPQTKRDNEESHNHAGQNQSSFAATLKATVNKIQEADKLYSNADETYTYNAKRQLQPFFYIPHKVYSI